VTSPVAVAATASFGADVLERLVARRPVSALLTRPDAPAGRGRKTVPPPAKGAAERLGIPVLQPERLVPALELGAPVVVAVAYGVIVPEDVLAERVWLNVHPSLLPRWRGAAPVERALMAGDAETGVTIIRLAKELDAGPIAAQEAFAIGEDDDAGAVYDTAAGVAVELLDGVLDEPGLDLRAQPDEGVTYASKIEPADRELDLSRPPQELVDRVRALSPHIGARAELHGRRVTVWRARVGADGTLEPLDVQPEGKRRMSYEAWLRGLRE
jgi:methionyl-tRNA formyltransferase